MSIHYNSSLITTRLTDVANAIDSGAGTSILRIMDVGLNTLSTIQIGKPSASVAGNILTFVSMPWVDPAPVGTGFPALARIETSSGFAVISGLTVGFGSTSFDVVLSAATISSGQTIAISPATITGQ